MTKLDRGAGWTLVGAMEKLDELRRLIAQHGTHGRLQTAIPGLALLTYDAPTLPAQVIYNPLVCVIAQGTKRTVLGDRIFEYDSGKFLAATVDLPVTGQVVQATRREPYLAVSLRLDPAVVASLLLQAGFGTASAADPVGLAVNEAPEDLLDAMIRMLRLLDQPQQIPVLAPMIEREIIFRLLEGPQGAMLRQIGSADSRLTQVSRAIRALRNDHAKPVSVAALARLAGMSVASFHRHFRAITAMSPLQYQKQIRLQEARALLIAEPGDVAGVGFRVGYESPSQFSREYARQFGAPPSRDAMNLRHNNEMQRAVA